VDLRRILIPVDFSECSKAALEYAIFFAQSFNAELTALHVWTLPSSASAANVRAAGGESLESMAQREASRALLEFLEPITRANAFDKVGTAIRFGSEADGILDAAKDYDMVVMGTNGRTGLSYWILGSVAEKVVRRAPCAVLTVRSRSP
jgi:universal stress protein A